MAILEKISEYEIQRGKPMPSKNHAILQNNLIFQLNLKYRNTYQILSEIALDLQDWESTPDIAIFSKMIIDFAIDEIRLSQVPLGVIEIISPTQALQELTDKIRRYFDKGVQSCWLVLPALQSIYVYKSATDHQVFTQQTTLQDAKLAIELALVEIFG
jgi:Uma2 family endonuclease